MPDRLTNSYVWTPRKGERYHWRGLTFVIVRTSLGFKWADIKVEGPDGWTKRQPLPLPEGSVRVDEAGRSVLDPPDCTSRDCQFVHVHGPEARPSA